MKLTVALLCSGFFSLGVMAALPEPECLTRPGPVAPVEPEQLEVENQQIQNYLESVEQDFSRWSWQLKNDMYAVAKIMDRYGYLYGYPSPTGDLKLPFERLVKADEIIGTFEKLPVDGDKFAEELGEMKALRDSIQTRLLPHTGVHTPVRQINLQKESRDFWRRPYADFLTPFYKVAQYYQSRGLEEEAGKATDKGKKFRAVLDELEIFERNRRLWWALDIFWWKWQEIQMKFVIASRMILSKSRRDSLGSKDTDWREWIASIGELAQEGPDKPNDHKSKLKRNYYRLLYRFFLAELKRAVYTEYGSPSKQDLRNQGRRLALRGAIPPEDPQQPRAWPPRIRNQWSEAQIRLNLPEAAADPRWMALDDYGFNINAAAQGRKTPFPLDILTQHFSKDPRNPHYKDRIISTMLERVLFNKDGKVRNKADTQARMVNNRRLIESRLPVQGPSTINYPDASTLKSARTEGASREDTP